MKPLIRNVGAVIAGFVAASIVMMIVESINGRFLYPDLGKAAQGVTDREVVRQLMATAPVGALLVVIVGWILGGLAGGWVAARIASLRQAIVVGILLTLSGIANNLMIPPPLWFWVVTFLVLLPSAYLGGRLASSRA